MLTFGLLDPADVYELLDPSTTNRKKSAETRKQIKQITQETNNNIEAVSAERNKQFSKIQKKRVTGETLSAFEQAVLKNTKVDESGKMQLDQDSDAAMLTELKKLTGKSTTNDLITPSAFETELAKSLKDDKTNFNGISVPTANDLINTGNLARKYCRKFQNTY